eukprot:g7567.t1
MDDVLISFKEAMLKSEHKRQQFVIDHGSNFKSDPKLLKKYYDEDLEILQKTFKEKLASYTDLGKKPDNRFYQDIPRYTDEGIEDLSKRLFDFTKNGAGTEWGSEFSRKYLANSVDPITNKARLRKLADHTEVASVPDRRVRGFANEKFKDPDFLKKLELDKLIRSEFSKNGNTMDDVLISFKEAMLKSEHKRQQFVIDHGSNFKSDPKLLKKYYDEDLEILQKTFKEKLASYTDLGKKPDNRFYQDIPRYTDEGIEDLSKRLFDFTKNGAGTEWGSEFSRKYL